ncbi:MAG: phosphoribosyltransferase [Planctomycetota bacterium]
MRVLLDQHAISAHVDALAVWAKKRFGTSPIVLAGVLDGALFFLSDVARRMPGRVRVSTIRASSYGDGMSSGLLRFDPDSLPNVAGHFVLLVDEICETGRTLRALADALRQRGAIDLATAALLCKPGKSEGGWRPDWVGFECPDQFVVGYGLDWAGEFRHLPLIACLESGDECLGPVALAERWLSEGVHS